jgi:peptidyl-prolyl cis-trans isomerase SurA
MVFASVNAQKSLMKKELVNIGGEKITVGEFLKVYEKNNKPVEGEEKTPLKDYLDLYINFKLKVREAEDLKMDTARSFVNELSGYRKQLAKPYFNDEKVNDALLKEAYQRLLKDVRASHILVMVTPDATPEDTIKAYNKIMKIRKEIMEGKDFGDAAVEYSDDPSAKDQKEIPGKQRYRKGNRGDLGYFSVFNMVYPFENAAYNTPVGQVSKPVRTKYGYHLVKVTDKRDAMGKAEVAHIFVALRPNASKEDSIRKTEKIFNVYKKIQNGMSFEDAVKEYSEDKGSAQNGGKLSKFTSNRIVPEFVIAVDNLDSGQISSPVHTNYGWHIIKLLNRERPQSFEKEKRWLEDRLKKDERSKKSKEAIINKIKKDNKIKIFDDAKKEIFAAIDTSILKRKFKADSLAGMTKPVMKLGKKCIFKKTGKPKIWTQYDFAKYAQIKQRPQENIDKNVYLEKLFKQFVDDKCVEYEDQHLEEHYPEFASLMKEYHDGILLFNLTDKKVWSKAVKDTVGLEKFFEQHRKDYMWGERVDATVYTIKNKNDVDKTVEIIKQYENDGDIAKALDSANIHSVRIDPGKYEKGDNKYVDSIPWKVGLSKPITSDVEDLTVLVKIKNVIPPVEKELNEARGIVTADYQNYLEKEWIKQLKKKYPVKINEKVLKEVLAIEK